MLRGWLRAAEELGMSTVAFAEFLCGPVEANHADLVMQIVPNLVSFDREDTTVAARLFNVGGRRRGSFVDCMIAASALRLGAALATENPDDFRRFEASGLVVV
jgi:predicted nucleic acid-binding protein